jgi:type IV secretory pathway TrbF-like protein
MSQQYTVSDDESASIKAARDARLQSQSTAADAETAARLADHAERIRAVHQEAAVDPKHVYRGRTDLRDKAEADIAALYIRAGIRAAEATVAAGNGDPEARSRLHAGKHD